MLFINLFFINIFSLLCFAQSPKLEEVTSKQDISKIRFLSHDGKFTYYQKNNGDLVLSTNYEVKKILPGNVDTRFHVLGSSSRKNIIIEKDLGFSDNQNIRKQNELYTVKFGNYKHRKIGLGRYPQLHLDDRWVSYFNFHTNKLTFKSMQAPFVTFEIMLNKHLNKYFIPTVVMLDETEILYTDQNEEGLTAILKYDRKSSSFDEILKAQPGMRIELCRNKDKLFIGRFPHETVDEESSIDFVTIKNGQIESISTNIYKSSNSDLGQIICHKDNEIFFIKSLPTKNKYFYYNDVFSLNIKTKKLTNISNFGYVFLLNEVDGTIIFPWGDRYYYVDRKNKTKDISL